MAHTPIWSDPRYAVAFRGAEVLLAHIARERWLDPALMDLWAVQHRLVMRAATLAARELTAEEPELEPRVRSL